MRTLPLPMAVAVLLFPFAVVAEPAQSKKRQPEKQVESTAAANHRRVESTPAFRLPAVTQEMNNGYAAAKAGDYFTAIRHFEKARELAPDAPEIRFNLALAEAKIPGRELRAIAWFGAYLGADRKTPKRAQVLEQMRLLLAKDRRNFEQWLQTVQDVANSFSGYARASGLFNVVNMYADAGDIAGAQAAAALIPASDSLRTSADKLVLLAQLNVGDIAGAKKTADRIQAIYDHAMRMTEAPTASGYSAAKSESAYALAHALTEIAKAQTAAGDRTAARTSLAAAEKVAARIAYVTYAIPVYTAIAGGLIVAGDREGARSTLETATKLVERNPEPHARISELSGVARTQLLAGDAPRADALFTLALREVAAQQPGDQRSGNLGVIAVAQAQGGDILAAQKTVEVILRNDDSADRAMHEIALAQIKAGDISGAQKTARLIKHEYTRIRAQSAIDQAQRPPGGVASDWLTLLGDGGTGHLCPLNQPMFLDLARYLKSLPANDNSHVFQVFRVITENRACANGVSSKMLAVLDGSAH